jgi:hypothetical protein
MILRMMISLQDKRNMLLEIKINNQKKIADVVDAVGEEECQYEAIDSVIPLK